MHTVGQVVAALAAAVDRDAGAVHRGAQHTFQLSGRVDVGAGALVREDPPAGQGGVGLERRHDVHRPLPLGGEGGAETADVATKLRLGQYEQRRAELRRQFDGVEFVDVEVSLAGGKTVRPRRGLLIDPLPAGRLVGRSQSHFTPSIPSSSSRP